jgi:hypothetical protein
MWNGRIARGHALIGALSLLIVLVGLIASTQAVRAEEAPITVPLTYIAGFSNFGPTTAAGTAEVWLNEAEVRLHVTGMPLLTNQLYACWLVNQSTSSFLSIGRFNAGSDGTALLDFTLQGSLPASYSMVLITVQPAGDNLSSAPTHIYSIAGFFPGNVAQEHQVQHLPDTGADAQHPPFETAAAQQVAASGTPMPPWLLLAPAIAAIAGFLFVMRQRTRLTP